MTNERQENDYASDSRTRDSVDGAAGWGRPVPLDLSLIDEDPDQPRSVDNPGFAPASLQELAATIRQRGVKTPISVRPNPDAPGRFIINHGARRFRGSRLAGKTTIPAFVDDDHSDVDQVVENLQRNELTAREIAEFIGRQLSKGQRKGQIADAIGKSAAFVSQHSVLLDLPGTVATAFNSARIKDVTVVNELVKCHRMMPQHVESWLADENQDITRGSVKLLREFLSRKLELEKATLFIAPACPLVEIPAPPPAAKARAQSRAWFQLPAIRVMHAGLHAHLLLDRVPTVEGRGWLRYEGDGVEAEVDLSLVGLLSLTLSR